MLIVLSLALIGALLGRYFRIGMLLAASGLILIVDASAWIFSSQFETVNLILLFAHLTALQGGFLIVSYFEHDDRL